MAVPQEELMKMIASQRDQATPGGMVETTEETVMSDATTPPMAAPMSTPEPKMGTKESAMLNLSMAMDLLNQSLPGIGVNSKEGKQVLDAIRVITGILGPDKERTDELQPTEILNMLQTLPQAGGATPESKAMSSAPAIPGMMPTPPAPAGGAASPLPQPI
jgi:hypothetical protein